MVQVSFDPAEIPLEKVEAAALAVNAILPR
jgi:hypothetical protein